MLPYLRTRAVVLLAGLAAAAAPARSQKPIAEVASSRATIRGSVVVLAGGRTGVISGSSVAAGETTVSMRLSRGGEVRICPRTSLSVSTTPAERDLMLAMGTGGLETHYSINHAADSILTPDFRILLAGPGTFHLAVASDARGNTCVRTLEGNTASVIISEQMGEGVYQVQAHDQVLFHNGTVANPDRTVPPDCGCPLPVPLHQAATAPGPPLAQEAAPLAPPDTKTAPPFMAPAPKPAPGEVHVQVDVPFVFRATEPALPDAPLVARLRLQPLPPLLLANPPRPSSPPPAAPPPSAAPTTRKRGLLGRLGSFFAAIFH